MGQSGKLAMHGSIKCNRFIGLSTYATQHARVEIYTCNLQQVLVTFPGTIQ